MRELPRAEDFGQSHPFDQILSDSIGYSHSSDLFADDFELFGEGEGHGWMLLIILKRMVGYWNGCGFVRPIPLRQ